MVRTLQPASLDGPEVISDSLVTDSVDTQVFRLMCEQLSGQAPRQLRNGGIVEFRIGGERVWLKAVRSYGDIYTVSKASGYRLPEKVEELFDGSPTIDVQAHWPTRTFEFKRSVTTYGKEIAGIPVRES